MVHLLPDRNNESYRTNVFEEGRVFSEYVMKEPSRFSGRIKYFMRPSSDSALSTHWCIGCKWAKVILEKELMIYHFKVPRKNKTQLTFDDSMNKYTPLIQYHMKRLFL